MTSRSKRMVILAIQNYSDFTENETVASTGKIMANDTLFLVLILIIKVSDDLNEINRYDKSCSFPTANFDPDSVENNASNQPCSSIQTENLEVITGEDSATNEPCSSFEAADFSATLHCTGKNQLFIA